MKRTEQGAHLFVDVVLGTEDEIAAEEGAHERVQVPGAVREHLEQQEAHRLVDDDETCQIARVRVRGSHDGKQLITQAVHNTTQVLS